VSVCDGSGRDGVSVSPRAYRARSRLYARTLRGPNVHVSLCRVRVDENMETRTRKETEVTDHLTVETLLYIRPVFFFLWVILKLSFFAGGGGLQRMKY